MNDLAAQPTLPRFARNPWLAAGLIVVVGAICNFWAIEEAPLARTEGHRAITGHQINQTGRWIVPTLFDKPYLRKPPLQYWVVAVTERVVGQAEEWVWRLPSAVGAIAMALTVWWFTRRWFDEPGGLAAGFTCLGLVAIWSQSRSADIDSLNTLTSTVCSLGLIEIGFGPGTGDDRASRRAWVTLGFAGLVALSMGAMWLLKGPAGMTAVLGVIFGASIAARRWKWLGRPSVWAPILIGIAIFAAWVIAAYFIVGDRPTADTSGITEILRRLSLHQGFRQVIRVVTMPLVLFVYALPATAMLPLVFTRPVWGEENDTRRRLVRATTGSFLAALVICMIVLMMQPRYGYVTFGLVCPPIGAIISAWHRGAFSDDRRTQLRQIATVISMIFAGLGIGLLVAAAVKQPGEDLPLRVGLGIALVVAGVGTVIAWIRIRRLAAAGSMIALLILASMAFNEYKNVERLERSSYLVAPTLREMIGGKGARIVADKAVADKPELFFYAEVDVYRPPEGIEAYLARSDGGWFAFEKHEWQRYQEQYPGRFTDVTRLEQAGHTIVARYLGPGDTQ